MWEMIEEGQKKVSFRLIWGEGYIWWEQVGERIEVLKDLKVYYDGLFVHLIVEFSLVDNNKLHLGDHTFGFVRALYCLEIKISGLFTYWEGDGHPSPLFSQHQSFFSSDHSSRLSLVRQLCGSSGQAQQSSPI